MNTHDDLLERIAELCRWTHARGRLLLEDREILSLLVDGIQEPLTSRDYSRLTQAVRRVVLRTEGTELQDEALWILRDLWLQAYCSSECDDHEQHEQQAVTTEPMDGQPELPAGIKRDGAAGST